MLRKFIAVVLWLLFVGLATAQEPIYLPIIWSNGMAINPILRVTNGTETIDLLGVDSGWQLEDPYWNPQIAQYKSGGSYVNSGLAEGQRLVHKEYDNVIESISLSARGYNQDKAIQTVRRLLQMAKQASDYWTKSYEYDDVWLEARPACNDCLIGYARIVKMSIPEITNPYGQPFFSSFNDAIMNGITLTIEREPLWRGVPPGEIIGPLYNLVKNPDFELWNSGTVDSQPDSWSDLETLQITGQNSRESTSPNSGQHALKIRVSQSLAAGKVKGVSQIVENTRSNTEYTIVVSVRSEGVSNGVGRILVTYSSQLEVYRSSDRHGWTLYTGKFTTGANDVVAINLEILTTAANTDGTIYIDSLMIVEGDWEEEAGNDTLPYLTSSHIVNHFDDDAGNINYVDAWNIPGDEDALIRLEMLNNTTPADDTAIVEDMAEIRIGQRRTGDVFDFDNYHDPPGVVDTSGSNADRITHTPTVAWVDVTTHDIVGAGVVADNVGRYRAFARVYDAKTSGNPTLLARLRYWKGVSSSGVTTLDSVAIPKRAMWNMVDLTPNRAIIWDAKGMTNFPGSLSCSVQFSRPSGTGNGRFDYLLLVPTDGGILTASVDPGIPPGIALVVDNTGSGMVSAAGIKNGYVLKSNTAGAYAQGLCEFKGAVYAAVVNLATQTLIYKYFGGVWTLLATYANEAEELGMAVYNGEMYMVREDVGAGFSYLWSTQDGINWTLRSTQAGQSVQLLSFGGYLWWIAGDGLALYRWNGTTAALDLTVAAGDSIRLGVYGNRLYRSNDVNLYVWNGAGWDIAVASAWGVFNPPGLIIEFNGKLLFQSGTRILAYDGNSVSQVTGWTFGTINAWMVMDNVIYATVTNTIYKSTDGLTWTQIYDTSTDGEVIRSILGYEGAIHFGTIAGVAPTAFLYSIIPDTAVEYSVADYQIGGGHNGGFVSPNRRLWDNPMRHRWVFSWDRSSGENNIADKALIGIGYVPRYLTLRGAN